MKHEVRLTYCPLCGFAAEELTIGEVVKYYSVESGELIGYGHPGGVLAHSLIESEVKYNTKTLDVTERAPAGEPCANCAADIAKQRAEFKVEIARGGIHWHCLACQVWGVIVHNDTRGFAAGVRARAGVEPPTHIGVKFKDCRQHQSEEDVEQTLH